MEVTSIVFNDNAKPLRNNTFIDVNHVGHRNVKMTLIEQGIVLILFPAPNPGSYGVPMSSLSHVKFEIPLQHMGVPKEEKEEVTPVELAKEEPAVEVKKKAKKKSSVKLPPLPPKS